MIEKVHEHIVNELQQSSRTDTIFTVTAVLFNLIILAINSSIANNASSKNANSSDDFVLVVFIFVSIIVNVVAIAALHTGKNTRNKLLHGLILMYKENQVEKYYDSSLMTNYNKRYFFLTVVIACLVVNSIIIPILIRFM